MSHINEKLDYTVEVFIVYKNKVLLRKHDKYGIWLSVGGHIEIGEEDPNQAAIREVKEEVGLDIELYRDPNLPFIEEKNYTEIIPPVFMNKHNITDNHEHVTLVYFAKSKTDKIIPCKMEVAKDFKWFELNELDSSDYEINLKIKVYAKKALERLTD